MEAAMPRNIKLVLCYDGTDFYGWQAQPSLTTIQGTLAAAIDRVTGETVLPQGSGRTDAGVHALAQVASFPLANPIPVNNLADALNRILPSSIRVLSAAETPESFHARHSAQAKTYRYRIYRGSICSPFVARQVYHHPYPLDEQAMIASAAVITGEHDFTSFASVDAEKNSDSGIRSNVRTIFNSDWRRSGEEFIYTVRGNGFLHHMVRNLVGTFLLLGKGTLASGDFAAILESRHRSRAGATAPASGLILLEVEY